MDLKLTKIADNVFYIPGSTNSGLIIEQEKDHVNLYMVDTPESTEKAQALLNLFENFCTEKLKQKWFLKAIFITHSHADHVSCASILKQKTSCEIWCTEEAAGNLFNPTYEQAIISGGWPLPELQTPFYQAEKVCDCKIIKPDSSIHLCDGTEITFEDLKGHHFGMVGVLVKTSGKKTVLFAADGIFDREQLKRYWIPFMLDIGSFKVSLNKIVEINADYVLPSHGMLFTGEKTEAVAELNRYAVNTTENQICRILEKPHTAEKLLKDIFSQNNIPCRLGQYILIGCTIRSYLSYLYRSGKIRYFFKDNLMFWQTV